MKFKTKYMLLALLMLLIILLAVFVCLKLSQHNQNNEGSSVAVSNSEDDTISDDEDEQIIEEEKDPRLSELKNDAWEYLMSVSAENNIELDTNKGVILGAYYNHENVLEVYFYMRDYSIEDRMLMFHKLAYYIQDWINDNYSDEELPFYMIDCRREQDNWTMLVDGYIYFSNYDSWLFDWQCRTNQNPVPARSMYCVDLQVNYTEENYEGLSFDGITFLRTSNWSDRMVEDYSVLKHFPDLERVDIPMLISKTDEEIEAFIEEIKQYLPPDCEIEIDQY